MDFLLDKLKILPIILIALTIHEVAHSAAAYALGDRYQKNSGRLSLNPINHLDPVGILSLLIFGFGWAKPVGVSPHNFNNPKRDMALVSFAGPLSNLILAIISTLLLIPFGNISFVSTFFVYMISINTSLFVFNLLPIPPLDGSKVIGAFLPDDLYYKFISFDNRYSSIIFIVLVYTKILNYIIGPITSAIVGFLLGLLPA